MTRQVMGNKVFFVLTVCFLFMAAQHLDAVIKQEFIYYPSIRLTWEKARLHCQKNNIDLISFKTLNRMVPSWFLKNPEILKTLPLWVGLVRHSEDATLWNEVSFKTGGLSEDKISRIINWDKGKMEPYCAFVSKSDQMWHSELCSNKKYFYCSLLDGIQYIEMASSWDNASNFCQNLTGQLVNMDDITAYSLNKTGWIGAHQRNYIWSWVGNFTPVLTKWALNEPQSQNCVAFNMSTKKYLRALCSKKLHPFCLNDNLLVVKENKTWEEALNHCLQLNACENYSSCNYTYNLLSLQERTNYNYIRERIYRATTAEVWTGLRFLGGSWWWADRKKLAKNWKLPSCPSEKNHCGALSKYGDKKCILMDCSKKQNFICYKTLNRN